MLTNISIEKIIASAIAITSILLIIAFYSFYQNHKKLQGLEEQLRETENKINLEQFKEVLDQVVLPDAREIFRPDVLGHHPVNGLQLAVLEYIFSTFHYNSATITEETELKSQLNNLLSIQKKFRVYYADHNRSLIWLCVLTVLSFSFWWVFLKLKLKKEPQKGKEEIAIGPKGFFRPVLKEGALDYFEGRYPVRIPKRHYTNLLLDIKEIERNKTSFIRGCYKPIRISKG
jgi:hypothetical protein